MSIGYPANWAANPKISSKSARNGSRDGFKPSDSREPSQPATIERRDLPPSAPSHSITERASSIVKQVGYATNGSGKFTKPSFENSGKHNGHHDPRTSTDNAKGMAWSASGGQFGKQSVPASRNTKHRAPDHSAQLARPSAAVLNGSLLPPKR